MINKTIFNSTDVNETGKLNTQSKRTIGCDVQYQTTHKEQQRNGEQNIMIK